MIVATAYGDSERTIRAMRDGAFDYVTKPFDLPALLVTVQRALEQRRMSRETRLPERPAHGRGGLVGSSAAMLVTWKLIGRAAASSAPVLVTGETGVGKELVARAVHDYSPRARRAVRGREPRCLAGGADRERAVRTRKGRLHGRDRAARRALRAGRWRHAAPG
ncbi:MAG: sigma 54-interacting transcriptional regulator [Polyangiaceae bacterium]